MKLIFRCILAIAAIIACFIIIKRDDNVLAQSFSDTCATEENNCLSAGGTSADCTTQYNNCISQRNALCQSNGGGPACSFYYNDNGPSCQSTCNPSGGCDNSQKPSCPVPICNNVGTNYYWTCNSPIIIDVEGKGFHLTSEEAGVLFDFSGNGQKEQVAWTDPRFGNAWLALDRNGNGKIDDSTELFGNFTPQPQSATPNGFLALAVYDTPEFGGNGDGYITDEDEIFSKLLVWTDTNHNGISEPNELKTLAQAGIASIPLHYSEGTRSDEYGNIFRYRGHIKMVGHRAYDHLIYDVYLVGAN
jgi:hypothetical protein